MTVPRAASTRSETDPGDIGSRSPGASTCCRQIHTSLASSRGKRQRSRRKRVIAVRLTHGVVFATRHGYQTHHGQQNDSNSLKLHFKTRLRSLAPEGPILNTCISAFDLVIRASGNCARMTFPSARVVNLPVFISNNQQAPFSFATFFTSFRFMRILDPAYHPNLPECDWTLYRMASEDAERSQ